MKGLNAGGFMGMLWMCWVQEYSEESSEEPDVDLENQYYNSKALKEENPERAIDNFRRVSPSPSRSRPGLNSWLAQKATFTVAAHYAKYGACLAHPCLVRGLLMY